MHVRDGANSLRGCEMRFARNRSLVAVAILSFSAAISASANEWVEYEAKQGPGAGKHIVLVSGDEEYRSEEALPMLAKILAVRHGFRCTVLFSINPADGTIDPTNQTNIPGFEKVADADLVVIGLRFRELPDDDMKHFVHHIEAGKPLLALRTSTHAFNYERNRDSPYAKYGWRSRDWPGGFGQQVLGETWVNHHGDHGKESSRGLINGQYADHPVLRGVRDIWGPTDVYGVKHLPADAKVLVFGQVLRGMSPTDAPNLDKSIMPMVWQREYSTSSGNTTNVLCSTIGAATDLESEGLRRLLVNYCYWALGLADDIPMAADPADVRYVGEYAPTEFGFDKWKRGMKPSDYALD
jgi:type 1 glutamine amidotransferase